MAQRQFDVPFLVSISLIQLPQIPPANPSMNIFANTVVTLSFDLYDSDNTLLESTAEPIAYIHGGYSGIPPKLEAALEGRKAGDTVSVSLDPIDAFGEYDASLVKIEPLSRLPDEVEKGMMFEAYTNDGNDGDQQGETTVFTVTDIAEGKAVLDGNHAWAGKRVRFDCKIVDVRPATPEELQHGHVHGPGGHHH